MWHQGKKGERPRREIGSKHRAVHATSTWVWCSRHDGALCLSTTLQGQRKLRIPKDIDRRKRPLFMSKVSVTITARSHLIITLEQRASYLITRWMWWNQHSTFQRLNKGQNKKFSPPTTVHPPSGSRDPSGRGGRRAPAHPAWQLGQQCWGYH